MHFLFQFRLKPQTKVVSDAIPVGFVQMHLNVSGQVTQTRLQMDLCMIHITQIMTASIRVMGVMEGLLC